MIEIIRITNFCLLFPNIYIDSEYLYNEKYTYKYAFFAGKIISKIDVVFPPFYQLLFCYLYFRKINSQKE